MYACLIFHNLNSSFMEEIIKKTFKVRSNISYVLQDNSSIGFRAIFSNNSLKIFHPSARVERVKLYDRSWLWPLFPLFTNNETNINIHDPKELLLNYVRVGIFF